MTRFTLLALIALAAACSSVAPPPTDPIQQQAAADPAVRALRDGDFAAAGDAATAALGADRRNAAAAAVRALAIYHRAGEDLRDELQAVIDGAEHGLGLDHARGRRAWDDFASTLAAVDADLAIAADDPQFSLELCLACWRHDWNHSGEVDDRDLRLFQIEVDARGEELPEDDARRTPTFRFDAGDIYWARAMIAFQRGLSELILAYKWNELDKLARLNFDKLAIRLDDAGRVRHARELIRAGLRFSDRSRELYLAETDDDREWVPNPRQRHFAVPLVLDDAMYDTWAAVTRDVNALVDGREGIALPDLLGKQAPGVTGMLDVGRLFDHPQDIVIDVRRIVDGRDGEEALGLLVHNLVGHAIVDRMPASPLVARLRRMAGEIDRDEDTFGRKLRYLLWIN